MSPEAKLSLRLRIAGLLILLAVITLAGVGFQSLRQDKRKILIEAENEARFIASRVAADVRDLVFATAPAADALAQNGLLTVTIADARFPFVLDHQRARPAVTAQIQRPSPPKGPTNRTMVDAFLPAPGVSSLPFCLVSKGGSLLYPPPFPDNSRIGRPPLAVPVEFRPIWDEGVRLLQAG